MMRFWRSAAVLAAGVALAGGTGWAMDGAYSFEFLQVETAAGRRAEQVRQASGELLFGNDGAIRYNGANGFAVAKGLGSLRLSHPLGADDMAVRVLVGDGEDVLLGAGSADGVASVLLAVKRPSGVPVIGPQDTFHGGVFTLLPAATTLAQSTAVRIQPGAAGFVPAQDGTGTLAIDGVGSYRVAISASGNVLIGAPLSGTGGLLFAVRESSMAPAGLFFALSISVERDAMRTALGSMVAGQDGIVRLSLSEHGPAGASDFRGTGSLKDWPLLAGHGNTLVAAAPGPESAWVLAAVPVPVAADAGGVFLHPFGIVDAASSAPTGNPLSPNSLVSLYGLRFSTGAHAAEQLPLPVSLGGTSVEVNGSPAGLLLVSPGQINLHMPEDITGESAVIQVIAPEGRSEPVPVRVAPASPGTFSVSQGGLGEGVVTHADFQLVSGASPARSGEVVIVFLTGLGKQQPPPAVLVNGVATELQYAGAHSVFVGLYQLNVKLPVFTANDPRATLTIRTREGYSDTVTLAVAP